jgi:hypothetical protein
VIDEVDIRLAETNASNRSEDHNGENGDRAGDQLHVAGADPAERLVVAADKLHVELGVQVVRVTGADGIAVRRASRSTFSRAISASARR